ncbi:RHS repeat-associated core domain-containing protein [Thiolapillus sp.]
MPFGTAPFPPPFFPFPRPIANNLGFPGQHYEEEKGLWQNWFRDYGHTTGRYVEGDPIGLGAKSG